MFHTKQELRATLRVGTRRRKGRGDGSSSDVAIGNIPSQNIKGGCTHKVHIGNKSNPSLWAKMERHGCADCCRESHPSTSCNSVLPSAIGGISKGHSNTYITLICVLCNLQHDGSHPVPKK